MPNATIYEIDAKTDDGRHERLKVRIADRMRDWTSGTFITLPNGQHVLIVEKGLYQAVSSGEVFRSDDPHAP